VTIAGKAEFAQSNRHQAMMARRFPACRSAGTESRTLTLTLSRFAGEGTLAVRLLKRVPSPTEWERVRVRAMHSV